MAIQVGIPQAAMNSLIDLVDNVAEVKPGWESCDRGSQRWALWGTKSGR